MPSAWTTPKYQILLEFYTHRKQSSTPPVRLFKDINTWKGKFHFTGRFVITQNPEYCIKTLNNPIGWLSLSENRYLHIQRWQRDLVARETATAILAPLTSRLIQNLAQTKPRAQFERHKKPKSPLAVQPPALRSSSGAPLAAAYCSSLPAHSSAWRNPGAACSAQPTA